MALRDQLFRPLQNFMKIIKHNGGIIGSYLALFRRDDLKEGTLVGTDKFGNEYFQNKYYFMGRSRWVNYSYKVGHNYDATQVPAEWHRWLQYVTDDPPTADGVLLPQRKWMAEHTENLTATSKEYVPYSTTKPKLEAWVPPSK